MWMKIVVLVIWSGHNILVLEGYGYDGSSGWETALRFGTESWFSIMLLPSKCEVKGEKGWITGKLIGGGCKWRGNRNDVITSLQIRAHGNVRRIGQYASSLCGTHGLKCCAKLERCHASIGSVWVNYTQQCCFWWYWLVILNIFLPCVLCILCEIWCLFGNFWDYSRDAAGRCDVFLNRPISNNSFKNKIRCLLEHI